LGIFTATAGEDARNEGDDKEEYSILQLGDAILELEEEQGHK